MTIKRINTGVLAAIALLMGSISACKPDIYTPKPTGYFRVDTPATHTYQSFNNATFPYSFEYPRYAALESDSFFFSEKADNPYWLNIQIPCLSATINLTYKTINSATQFDKLVEDCYKLSFFHHEKADYIDEHVFKTQSGVSGILYVVGGNAASKYQFTITDSVHHFVRGALYFNVTPNADSLKPANDFLYQDIEYFIKIFKFK